MAFTRSTPAFRSAIASSFPTSSSPYTIGSAKYPQRRRLVHLQLVLEAEQLRRALAVVSQPVERRQQRHPSLEAVEVVQVGGADAPLALDAGFTQVSGVGR